MPGKSFIRQLLPEPLRLLIIQILNQPLNMQVDDGLAAFGRQQEPAILLVVLIKSF